MGDTRTAPSTTNYKWDIVWYNVAILTVWHIGAIYGAYVMVKTASWAFFGLFIALWWFSGLGITGGVHRLWAHRSYKATTSLRVFLMLVNSMAFQGSIWEWARDHRVHHKASETDADPHNAQRGLFFSHMGWVMVRKHADVKKLGGKLSMADLDNDPVVAFQKKYYISTVLVMCYALPTILGAAMGNAWAGFWVGGVFRHVWVLHMTWMVNSVAHFHGTRPYDPTINPAENLLVSICAIGEGWHNFHHAYPYDYAAGEWGLDSGVWNPTKLFIDAASYLGFARDRKRAVFVKRKEEARRLQATATPAAEPLPKEEAMPKNKSMKHGKKGESLRHRGTSAAALMREFVFGPKDSFVN